LLRFVPSHADCRILLPEEHNGEEDIHEHNKRQEYKGAHNVLAMDVVDGCNNICELAIRKEHQDARYIQNRLISTRFEDHVNRSPYKKGDEHDVCACMDCIEDRPIDLT